MYRGNMLQTQYTVYRFGAARHNGPNKKITQQENNR